MFSCRTAALLTMEILQKRRSCARSTHCWRGRSILAAAKEAPSSDSRAHQAAPLLGVRFYFANTTNDDDFVTADRVRCVIASCCVHRRRVAPLISADVVNIHFFHRKSVITSNRKQSSLHDA